LTVSDSLLGQVIEDDQGVLSVVTEVLSHGGTGEGSKVLQRGGVGGGSGDDDRVLESVVLLEGLDELCDGGPLLADGDVDTVELLGLVSTVVEPLLVEDGVESDGWGKKRRFEMSGSKNNLRPRRGRDNSPVFPVCLSPMISSR
jgi:hypothetical protein